VLPAALYASAYADAWQGRLRRAYVHAGEARLLADEGTNRLWQFLSTGVLALTESLRGNLDECRRLAAYNRQMCDDIDLWLPRDVDDALGLAALSTGDLPTALRHLERANTPEPLGPPIFGRPTAADLVEAQVRAGRPVADTIARHIDRPVPADFPAVAAAVWRCRALVGAADADVGFQAALACYGVVDLPWQEARTHLSYGEQLRRAGRRVDAREQLRRAREMFGDMGSRLWADRAAAELAAAGGETGCARAASADSLTPQELHVALAVAAGATNREVSGELFLSPKTVEMHLTRVYRKLGLRSRTDLASYFARR
jgi:DNA-binding CsgD family transcriptional regulator